MPTRARTWLQDLGNYSDRPPVLSPNLTPANPWRLLASHLYNAPDAFLPSAFLSRARGFPLCRLPSLRRHAQLPAIQEFLLKVHHQQIYLLHLSITQIRGREEARLKKVTSAPSTRTTSSHSRPHPRNPIRSRPQWRLQGPALRQMGLSQHQCHDALPNRSGSSAHWQARCSIAAGSWPRLQDCRPGGSSRPCFPEILHLQ